MASETARAEEVLEELRRWEWENEKARETAHEDKVESHNWLLGPADRARTLRLMQHQPRAHSPRGVPARGDSAAVDSCAGIAKGTGLGLQRPFRERAGTPALSPLFGTERDELDARFRGDRPRFCMPEGRASAAGIRLQGDLLQQRVRFLKTEAGRGPAGGRAAWREELRRRGAPRSQWRRGALERAQSSRPARGL